MNKRILDKILAGIMTFCLIVSIIPAQSINKVNSINKVYAAGNDTKTAKTGEDAEEEPEIEYKRIEIKTADDFINFAKNCYIDSWSKDKYVILKNDISFTDTEITPIAVFDGIFDGNNHTISNFDYTGEGYVTGLFRYIEGNGVVKNLTLKGNVESKNEEECIGSICGVNYGTIANCTFDGTVSGRDTVGGIVGINESQGMVSKCVSKGRVTAYYSTGGIAGINHGDINNCVNRAGINDDTAWVEVDDEMGGVELVKNLVSNDDNEVYSGVDTGGIVGYSDGLISRCSNYGIVGYEHTGYNIGGIAGRQSGVVSLCTNVGTVYGRKDVGGIAGQMEPYIEIDEAESLRNAINKLHDLINKTLDDMDSSNEVLSSDVDSMMSYADTAIDTGDVLIDELESFVNDNLDEVNSASDRFDNVMDMIPDVLDNIDLAGDAMGRLNDIIGELMDDLAIMDKLEDTPYNETDYNRLTLLTTVGGTLTTNKTSPQEGDEVTITSKPDDGYKLKSIVVTDANGKNVDIQPDNNDGDKYTFIMPSENVKVEAEFEYIGTFLTKSDPGGTIEMEHDDGSNTYKFTAEASSNAYQFDGFDVIYNGNTIATEAGTSLTLVKDGNSVKKDNNTILNNMDKSITVYAKFTPRSGVTYYTVTIADGTGGSADVRDSNGSTIIGSNSKGKVADGTTITVHMNPNSGYEVGDASLEINGSTIDRNRIHNNEYTLTVNSDENIKVSFAYNGDSNVYTVSNTGGTSSAAYIGNNQYRITVQPYDGYTISPDDISIDDYTGQPTTASAISTYSADEEVVDEKILDEEVANEEIKDEEVADEEESTIGGLQETDVNDEADDGIVNIEDEEVGLISSPTRMASYRAATTLNNANIDMEQASDGTITFTITTSDFTGDRIKIYSEFKEDPNYIQPAEEHIISKVTSTGGYISAPDTANSGDKVTITPIAEGAYILDTIKVTTDNTTNVQLTRNGNNYSFTMPNEDVTIEAQFVPIDIILKSNLSGSATYSGNSDGTITVRISPDTAYTVDSTPTVTDDNGKGIGVTKKQSGSYVYQFNTNDIGKSPCTVNIVFKKENQKQAVETSSDNISDSVGELSDAAAEVQDSAQRISDILGENTSQTDTLTTKQKNELIDELPDLLTGLGDMSAAAASILRNLTTIYNILEPYVTDAAKAAKDDIERATDEVDEMLDYLKEANNNVKAIVNYINGQASLKFTKLGDDFDETKENFHDQLRDLSDSVKTLSDNAKDCSEVVNDDLRAVNDQLNVVLNLLADRLVDVEDLNIDELYEEVDEDDLDSITTGRVDICNNKGTVSGDINVGGIAGSMSIDDEDPEDSAAGEIEYEIGRRFITKCLVTDSVNDGFVTAKKDGAGGICGYMNHGIILDSESYGSVESTEGDYVGGICGESLTIIRRCYAISSVSGGQNVGGIAGYAQTLTDCYSMSNVTATDGRVGAIAGEVASYEDTPANYEQESDESKSEDEEDDKDTKPEVYGNYYVDDELYGIDNISYVGVAEPLTYSELLEVENLPTNFRHLKVIYKIEDTYLGSQEVKYGKKLDNLTYPEIPEKDDCYGVWPDVTDQRMKGVVVVEAEYVDNVTVIQSSGVENGKPLAFIEDRFTKDTVLIAKMSDFAPPKQAQDKQNIVYELSLVDDMVSDDDTFQVRLLNPYEDDAKVYGYVDGTWTELESKVRGQYVQVEMKGSKEYFCVANNKSDNLIKIIIIAVAAAAVVLLLVLIKKGVLRIKKKKLGA